MPFDRQALVLSFLFEVAGTDEVAETSLRLSGGTSFDAAAALAGYDEDDLETCSDAYLFMLGAGNFAWADYSRLTGAKLAAVDATGHYITDPLVYTDLTPTNGTNGAVPPQLTVVVSLRTVTNVGRATRGRMYLPHTSLPLGSAQPWATPATTDAAAVAAANFIEAINDLFNTGANPSIVSIMSSEGSGTTRGVTEVRVGNVVDTQRRRRDQLPEVYSSAGVVV